MTRVRVRAPAKINLALHVGPLTKGYHQLLTVFQAVDLYDTLTAEEASSPSLTIRGDVNVTEVPFDEENLIFKAQRALERETGVSGSLAFSVEKRIPVGGGMAGGSADAAAALVAVDAVWGTKLSRERLLALAAVLGSDVPFALEGATQVGRGRGEMLEPVESLPFFWVVVPQQIQLSTPRVYKTFDELQAGAPIPLPEAPSEGLLSALASGDARALAGELVNDLARAAITHAPAISAVLEQGLSLGALAAMVSGSGPSCLFLAEDAEHQARLVEGFEAASVSVRAVSSPAEGAHRVSPDEPQPAR